MTLKKVFMPVSPGQALSDSGGGPSGWAGALARRRRPNYRPINRCYLTLHTKPRALLPCVPRVIQNTRRPCHGDRWGSVRDLLQKSR